MKDLLKIWSQYPGSVVPLTIFYFRQIKCHKVLENMAKGWLNPIWAMPKWTCVTVTVTACFSPGHLCLLLSPVWNNFNLPLRRSLHPKVRFNFLDATEQSHPMSSFYSLRHLNYWHTAWALEYNICFEQYSLLQACLLTLVHSGASRSNWNMSALTLTGTSWVKQMNQSEVQQVNS